MIEGKRVALVMPAYNAARTLEQTWRAVPAGLVDHALLVDDASRDDTVAIAARLQIPTVVHTVNGGYGANQKTCYRKALETDADLIAMLHPDLQYPGERLDELLRPLARGEADLMLGSRFAALDPRAGGMPAYKYYANRALTRFQNTVLHTRLSEFHTGYRAYSRALLTQLPFEHYRDDFIFDIQLLTHAIEAGARIGEIACPARYFEGASSVNWATSIHYGLGVVATTLRLWAHRRGLVKNAVFAVTGHRYHHER